MKIIASNIEINDPHCLECGNKCKTLNDPYEGIVSECCGVGINYVDELGNEIELNENLRYVSDWND